MKICTGCKKERPEEDFSWQRGKRRARCKTCETRAERSRYQANPKRGYDRMKKIRNRNRQFIWDFYSAHPCVDCGEPDPVVLELDHIRGEKIAGVSQLVHNTRSLDAIKKEIAKCEVVCANCHRRRTAKQQDWFIGTI